MSVINVRIEAKLSNSWRIPNICILLLIIDLRSESRVNGRGECVRMKGRERKVEGKITYDKIEMSRSGGENELKLEEINGIGEEEIRSKKGIEVKKVGEKIYMDERPER